MLSNQLQWYRDAQVLDKLVVALSNRVEFGEADDIYFKLLFTWNITGDLYFVDGIGFGAPEGKWAEYTLWRNTGQSLTLVTLGI